MELRRYPYFVNDDFQNYEFYSEGPNGRIKKAVRFTRISNDGPIVYNLAFGDVLEENDSIDDCIVSNNNDRDLVLATVAKTIIDFTNIHGNHYVFAMGSTPSRTRLYQLSISKLWHEIDANFYVLALKDNSWHPFEKNVNYIAFLVKRK